MHKGIIVGWCYHLQYWKSNVILDTIASLSKNKKLITYNCLYV